MCISHEPFTWGWMVDTYSPLKIWWCLFWGWLKKAGLPWFTTLHNSKEVYGGVEKYPQVRNRPKHGHNMCRLSPHVVPSITATPDFRKGRRPTSTPSKEGTEIAVGLLWNLLRKLVSLCNWWMTTFFFLARICIHRVISGFNGWSHLEVL